MEELTEAVVAAARAGEPAALSTVFSVLAPRVQAYLAVRGVEDPEGMTSEVFLQALPRLGTLRGGPSGLRTFVFSIAHARSVDEHRARVRRPRPVPYDPSMDDRRQASAEAELVGSLDANGLTSTLATLPEDQRIAITLRVVGDLSLDQTAALMGRSVGSVKQLQRRGLLRLRELITSGQLEVGQP